MVGLGESLEEVLEEVLDALGTLRQSGVQIITVGQYLRPTARHLPVVRYWHPDEFKAVEEAGYVLGFDHIAAGPLVRSSYHSTSRKTSPAWVRWLPQAERGGRIRRGSASVPRAGRV